MVEYGIATGTVGGSVGGGGGYRGGGGGGGSNISYWVGYFEQNPEIMIAALVGIFLVARYVLAR
ncbi:hypothetical protein [Ruegeria lacuscaerulensis]|uniref:hypothetical protein n=1 Tax=Ruegeria lacuscaerulensis TaxID=55218 RepID=UPI00147B7D04|nr:hypothetical protein [Ruegeria lacuscaerulensis]